MSEQEVSQRSIAISAGFTTDLQLIEFERRLAEVIRQGNIVITHELGTFYLKKTKATFRILNGVRHEIKARECIAIRGKCFEPREPIPEEPLTGRRFEVVNVNEIVQSTRQRNTTFVNVTFPSFLMPELFAEIRWTFNVIEPDDNFIDPFNETIFRYQVTAEIIDTNLTFVSMFVNSFDFPVDNSSGLTRDVAFIIRPGDAFRSQVSIRFENPSRPNEFISFTTAIRSGGPTGV